MPVKMKKIILAIGIAAILIGWFLYGKYSAYQSILDTIDQINRLGDQDAYDAISNAVHLALKTKQPQVAEFRSTFYMTYLSKDGFEERFSPKQTLNNEDNYSLNKILKFSEPKNIDVSMNCKGITETADGECITEENRAYRAEVKCRESAETDPILGTKNQLCDITVSGISGITGSNAATMVENPIVNEFIQEITNKIPIIVENLKQVSFIDVLVNESAYVGSAAEARLELASDLSLLSQVLLHAPYIDGIKNGKIEYFLDGKKSISESLAACLSGLPVSLGGEYIAGDEFQELNEFLPKWYEKQHSRLFDEKETMPEKALYRCTALYSRFRMQARVCAEMEKAISFHTINLVNWMLGKDGSFILADGITLCSKEHMQMILDIDMINGDTNAGLSKNDIILDESLSDDVGLVEIENGFVVKSKDVNPRQVRLEVRKEQQHYSVRITRP